MVFQPGRNIKPYGAISDRGSALIMVLWTLVIIGFLSGEYLDHNREKAAFAQNAWFAFKQQQAVFSILQLMEADAWPMLPEVLQKRGWAKLFPCGIELWCRVETESERVDINTASENRIREKLEEMYGEAPTDVIDQLVDAFLDWRDPDRLVRPHGAESEFYETEALGFRTADGPFKVLTELMLVRGVTRNMFWGDPMGRLKANHADESPGISLLEAFTIYGKDRLRVSIMIPGRQENYTLIVAILKRDGNRWQREHVYESMRAIPVKKKGLLEGTESSIEYS